MHDVSIIPRTLRTYYATWAARPTSDLYVGDMLYATDRKCLYRWNGSAWDSVSVYSSSGLLADRPTATDLPDNSLYYATDNKTTYQVIAGAWQEIAKMPPTVAFPDTTIYTGAGVSSYTVLDLSSTIGANQAIVMLKYENASYNVFNIRTNGETVENGFYPKNNTTSPLYALVLTDSAGKIQWKSSGETSGTTIKLIAYWKA